MNFTSRAFHHIKESARIPSFSTYEERIHPYIKEIFTRIPGAGYIEVPGNSLIYKLQSPGTEYTIALAAHLDKINHYGSDFPPQLPVEEGENYLEGAMDDCAGLGVLLALAEKSEELRSRPNLLFYFSEMEESKGLKEHPKLLKNNGQGYNNGMGARRISKACLENGNIPDEIITVDTTPLFKGDPGIALYSNHWELTDLEASEDLINKTKATVQRVKSIEPKIKLANNTNDYLHYGYEFNKDLDKSVVSVALEPAIFPYHQKGERVFKNDISRVMNILVRYLDEVGL